MTSSGVTIRPIRDDDDLDELHEGDIDWAGQQLARRLATSTGDAMLAFDVAVRDGQLVGYVDGYLTVDDNPTHSGGLSVWVSPHSRGQGIGSALLESALAVARERGAHRLISHVDSTDEASLRWLRSRGATTGGTHLQSMLELGDDLPLMPPPEGVAVERMPDDASEEDWHSVHNAHVRLARDTPDAETNPTPIPYDVYRALVAEPWQVCLAKTSDGEIVGLTSVFPKNEKARHVDTMLTAVNREWRGRGLAKALKTAIAIHLRDAGWRAIVTQNMEGNDHILAANNRLGFVPSSSTFDVIYEFADSARS